MGTSQPGSPGFSDGFKGILIYLLVYTFMNLGAFAVITSLRQRNVVGDEIDDMAGLYRRAPVEAALMLLFLLSLAGIPPAAGFLGKYYIFLSLIESGHYGLASLGVIYSLFGLYYYLKIANAMLMRAPTETEPLPVSFGMRCAVGITALATIVIGVYPRHVFTKKRPSRLACSLFRDRIYYSGGDPTGFLPGQVGGLLAAY